MRAALLCFLCIVCTICFSQENPPDQGELHFDSRAFSLCITPSEKLIITTRVGEIASADNVKSKWNKTYPDASGKNETRYGVTLDNANFFNNDTGFVSGFISNNGAYNIIYQTTNGGSTWKPLVFGKGGGWVDDAINLHNGEAWMSVSGDGLYYTNDYGFKWEHFKTPEPKQRFTKIYFNTAREGLIGSLENMIAYTPNNCRTWQLLPTPLDQKAYVKTYPDYRADISNVAILPGILLVKQEELVFWTRRDKIEWKLLKDYNDFYTDVYNSAVYFKKGDKTIVKTDNNLIATAETRLTCDINKAQCKGGKLFVFSGSQVCRLDADMTPGYYSLLTTQLKAMEPAHMGYGKQGMYGNLGNKVYSQQDYNTGWEYAFTLPFDVDGGTLNMHNDLVLFSKGDSLSYYNAAAKSTDHVSREQMFTEFAEQAITEIVFSTGSRGCFHYYNNSATYRNDGCNFTFTTNNVEDKDDNLPEGPRSFDENIVRTFLQQLPGMLTAMPTVQSLNISEKDYQQCKADIIAFKNSIGARNRQKETKFSLPKNNIDFDLLLSLVDSVKTLEPVRLNAMLYYLGTGWSTTTNWKSLTFTNAKRQTLSITNNHRYPNSLHFPWTISLNGYSINLNSPDITAFVKAVYPAMISKKDNVDILHRLVEQLYPED